jgi:hypothetical protein
VSSRVRSRRCAPLATAARCSSRIRVRRRRRRRRRRRSCRRNGVKRRLLRECASLVVAGVVDRLQTNSFFFFFFFFFPFAFSASLSEGLHVAIRARNAPEQNELSFSVGDKLLVLKLDPGPSLHARMPFLTVSFLQTAHSRVYASNESRGSVSGWAPSAALRPATDAEIAMRVSGVSTAYVANAGLFISGRPRLPHRRLTTIWTTDRRSTPTASRTSEFPSGRVVACRSIARCRQAGGACHHRPRASIASWRPPSSSTAFARAAPSAGASSTIVDPYATVASDIVENMDRVAAATATRRRRHRLRYATPAAAAAAAPMPPQMEGVARGYSSGAAGTRRHSSYQPDTRDRAYSIRNRICERSSTARRPSSTGSCS